MKISAAWDGKIGRRHSPRIPKPSDRRRMQDDPRIDPRNDPEYFSFDQECACFRGYECTRTDTRTDEQSL